MNFNGYILEFNTNKDILIIMVKKIIFIENMKTRTTWLDYFIS